MSRTLGALTDASPANTTKKCVGRERRRIARVIAIQQGNTEYQNARMFAMVVLVEEFRFTNPASASVPVFTDQRSTPHCARIKVGAETAIRTIAIGRNKRVRSNIKPSGQAGWDKLVKI